MKKQLYIFLNLIFASLFISSLYGMEASSPSSNKPAKSSFITSIKNLAYKTPFFACWHSNLAQKEAAQETIKNLLFEKAQLKTKLHAPNVEQKEKETILQQITEINKQIHDQKVITGEKWSNSRNIIWKSIKTSVCIISGIAIIALIKKYKKDYDNLYKQSLHTKTQFTVTKNAFKKKYTNQKKIYNDIKNEYLVTLEKKKKKIKHLIKLIDEYNVIKQLDKYNDQLDDLIKTKEKNERIKDQLYSCYKTINEKDTNIEDLNKKNNEYLTEIINLRKERKEHLLKISQLEQDSNNVLNPLEKIAMQKKINQLEESLERKNKTIKNLTKQITNFSQEIKNSTKQITDLSQKLGKYWKIEEDLIKFKSCLDQCSKCKHAFTQLSEAINNTIYKKNNQ